MGGVILPMMSYYGPPRRRGPRSAILGRVGSPGASRTEMGRLVAETQASRRPFVAPGWMWPSGLAIPSRRRPHRDWGPANESLQADTSASGGADGPTTTRGAITSAAFHWSPPSSAHGAVATPKTADDGGPRRVSVGRGRPGLVGFVAPPTRRPLGTARCTGRRRGPLPGVPRSHPLTTVARAYGHRRREPRGEGQPLETPQCRKLTVGRSLVRHLRQT